VPGTPDKLKKKEVWCPIQKKLETNITYIFTAYRKESSYIAQLCYVNFSLQSQFALKWLITEFFFQISRLINAASMYMNKDLWYPYKAPLVLQVVSGLATAGLEHTPNAMFAPS
jgi:hypothetical protein